MNYTLIELDDYVKTLQQNMNNKSFGRSVSNTEVILLSLVEYIKNKGVNDYLIELYDTSLILSSDSLHVLTPKDCPVEYEHFYSHKKYQEILPYIKQWLSQNQLEEKVEATLLPLRKGFGVFESDSNVFLAIEDLEFLANVK